MRAIVVNSTHRAARRAACADGRVAGVLAQSAGAATCTITRVLLEAVVAHAQALLVRQHLAVSATRRLHRLAVVGSREGEGHVRCGRPAGRPAARWRIAAARRPPPHRHQALGVVYIVEQHVRHAHPPVAVIPTVGVGRRVVKVDPTGHAVKGYALDQRLEQLATHNLCSILHLEQVVQRVGDREGRIVAKCVEARLAQRVVTCAPQRRAGIVVVVLRPQVGAASDVRLQAARAVVCHHGRQLPSALQVGIVRSTPLTVARLHGKKAPEGALVLGRLAAP
eukprot:2546110-Prymnesium_polylepis.1